MILVTYTMKSEPRKEEFEQNKDKNTGFDHWPKFMHTILTTDYQLSIYVGPCHYIIFHTFMFTFGPWFY